jgi:hypothetical protein
MACVTIASSYGNNSSINPRDDSFSSYLTLVRESFSIETSHTGRTRSSLQINSSRRRSNDGEIDIFDAEKYFNGTMEYNTDILFGKEINLPYKKDKKCSAQSRSKKTASVCSEASTGNSHTGLLRQHSRMVKAEGRKLLRVFLCTCSGKKATDTEVDAGSTRDSFGPFGESNMKDERRLDSEMRMKRLQLGFTDGLFNGAGSLKSIEAKEVFIRELMEGEKKVSSGTGKSLYPSSEIQSSSVNAVSNGGSGSTYNHGSVGRGNKYDSDEDDISSESSSDLFEISSISIKSHPFFEPDMDESVVYEPSEASINWSIVTASAANFSVASQSDEPRKKSMNRGRKGLLMGCVSHKAVNVTSDSHQNKLTKRAGTAEMPVQIGHEGLVAPAMKYRVESLKKTEMRTAPLQRQHVTPASGPLSHIQAQQPIYIRY